MKTHRHDNTQHGLSEQVHHVLSRSPYFAGRSLRVEVENDSVTLRGVVGSYYQKQVAQETLRDIDGIDCIQNELEVISR
jgi:osmotically-inducible protein OsmY